MSEIIADLDTSRLTDSVRNNEYFKKMYTPKKLKTAKLLFNYNDNPHTPVYLYDINNSNVIFGFNLEDNSIEYYMEYVVVDDNFFGVDTVTQVYVWAIPTIEYRSIVNYVFSEFLLKNYTNIMADSEQTVSGKRMWLRWAYDAYHSGYAVFLADFGNKTFNPINLKNEFKALENKIWGNLKKYRDMRLVICGEKHTRGGVNEKV